MLVAAITVAGLMLLTWIVSGLVKDASIVDLIWGFGFVLVGWAVMVATSPAGSRGWLLAVLTTVWGLR
ncbi:MAG: DUF1295 domain-containing protein, partial [Acidimicrobiia bacterium]